jgi:hypothetical protein
MGKVFIEKLLRVTKIGKIILLIRHKKGIDPKERLISLINDAVSDRANIFSPQKKMHNSFFISRLSMVLRSK